jgi:hypothetical protein
MDSTKQAIDILSFDSVKRSEAGYEFELKQPDGQTGTGVYLTIRGRHADIVQDWIAGTINAATQKAEYAKKRGKDVEPETLEEIRDSNRKGALIRVIGWRNVQQDYSADIMEQALRRNPHWVDQILTQSNDLANFSQAPSAT